MQQAAATTFTQSQQHQPLTKQFYLDQQLPLTILLLLVVALLVLVEVVPVVLEQELNFYYF
jgi:hypothetical protein